MNIAYCVNNIERHLKIMENVIDSHKTIPDLAYNNDFFGAESNCSTFIHNAIRLGADVQSYIDRYESLLERFSRLTENLFEKNKKKIKSEKSLEYETDKEYNPKIISTKHLRLH